MYQRITATLLAAFLFLSMGCTKQPKPPITPQQKASHLVFFLDKDGNPVSSCTATAIGPAVILTAVHCAEDDSISTKLRFDFSTHIFEAVAATTDGRDHMLIGLSEAPFKNFADIDATPKDFTPQEPIYIYGCGGRQFPCELKIGKFLGHDEVSEIDQNAGFGYYSIQAVPGDSGSAVFNSRGQIVSVFTYGMSEVKTFLFFWHYTVSTGSAGFTLAFTPQQIEIAKKYNPAEALNVNNPTAINSDKPNIK